MTSWRLTTSSLRPHRVLSPASLFSKVLFNQTYYFIFISKSGASGLSSLIFVRFFFSSSTSSPFCRRTTNQLTKTLSQLFFLTSVTYFSASRNQLQPFFFFHNEIFSIKTTRLLCIPWFLCRRFAGNLSGCWHWARKKRLRLALGEMRVFRKRRVQIYVWGGGERVKGSKKWRRSAAVVGEAGVSGRLAVVTWGQPSVLGEYQWWLSLWPGTRTHFCSITKTHCFHPTLPHQWLHWLCILLFLWLWMEYSTHSWLAAVWND